jgi:hypothetical protein
MTLELASLKVGDKIRLITDPATTAVVSGIGRANVFAITTNDDAEVIAEPALWEPVPPALVAPRTIWAFHRPGIIEPCATLEWCFRNGTPEIPHFRIPAVVLVE